MTYCNLVNVPQGEISLAFYPWHFYLLMYIAAFGLTHTVRCTFNIVNSTIL